MQRLAELPSRALRAVSSPSPETARSGALVRLASMLLAAGLLTVSWERLANVVVASYNVKLPALLLCGAALLAIPGWSRWLRAIRLRRPVVRWITLLLVATVLLFIVRALTSFPLGLGLAQVAAVATGAVAPALAVLGILRTAQDAVWALRWFVAGAVAGSVFGLYQLIAFYTGLPQGIVYTGVGTSGVGGRISAFSYEPAYFAYFLVLALGAVLAIAHLTSRRVPWLGVGFFSLVLVLVNVRALLFLLPVFAVLLAIEWRRNRMVLLKGAVCGVVALGLVTVVTAGTTALLSSPEPVSTNTAAELPGSAGPSIPSDEGGASPVPAPPQLPGDVLDPSEASSNGPRLDLYKAVLRVDLQHPFVGVGPGHLHDALAANGYTAPNQGANVVANNIWLQAVVDGGILLLLLESAVLVGLAILWWKARRTAVHPIAASLLAVLLVGGMLTSYFFDIKVWVMLALAVVVAVGASQDVGRPDSASA